MRKGAPNCRRNNTGRRAQISVTSDRKPNQKDNRRFRRQNRLPDAEAFQRVFKHANRSRDSLFTVLSSTTNNRNPRLGLAISRKNCRLAVQRNRLKRIVRESFRLHKDDLRGLDVVVMCQGAAARANNRELFDSLATHWRRCRENRGRDG